jgi:hypothetical protein
VCEHGVFCKATIPVLKETWFLLYKNTPNEEYYLLEIGALGET